MSTMSCFKAYDIRGRLGDELNEEIAWRIGRATASYLKAKKMVIGGDVRLSTPGLKQALARGLTEAGCDVIDLGLTGTEEIYFATWHLGVDGGIEVTASHNPADYNGMKLVREGSRPISGDTGLHAIRDMARLGAFGPAAAHPGRLVRQSVLDDYIEHLLGYIDLASLRPLKLVCNVGNGAAGHVLEAIERRFRQRGIPVTLIPLHAEPDGHFPHGIPNPLLPECRDDTARAVRACRADMGIAWDGDFDRCFLFDERGEFIEGYYIVGLLAESFLLRHPGSRIIHDPRLQWNTQQIVQANGGIPVLSKTGHAFIKERMRTEDAIYGGEMSAHHYFRDFAYCDSGMIPWLLVAALMSHRQLPLSALVAERIAAYPSSGEINSHLSAPQEAIRRVYDRYAGQALEEDHTDGISLAFDGWRFNLRSSNTEPVVRLNVESRADPALMAARTKEILTLLRQEA